MRRHVSSNKAQLKAVNLGWKCFEVFCTSAYILTACECARSYNEACILFATWLNQVDAPLFDMILSPCIIPRQARFVFPFVEFSEKSSVVLILYVLSWLLHVLVYYYYYDVFNIFLGFQSNTFPPVPLESSTGINNIDSTGSVSVKVGMNMLPLVSLSSHIASISPLKLLGCSCVLCNEIFGCDLTK
jgi:hypothetical protein